MAGSASPRSAPPPGGRAFARRAVAVLAVGLLAGPAGGRARELTRAERDGKRIYFEGTSGDGGAITALVAGGTAVPAAAVACATCHGEDGLGRAEGGVVPPAITWSALTK